jgi:hypothetical protein
MASVAATGMIKLRPASATAGFGRGRAPAPAPALPGAESGPPSPGQGPDAPGPSSSPGAPGAGGSASESLKAANRALVEQIKAQLSDDAKFGSFRAESAQFMRGDVSAGQLHSRMVAYGLLGLVTQLASLCPAGDRRGELLAAHKAYLASPAAQAPSSTGGRPGAGVGQGGRPRRSWDPARPDKALPLPVFGPPLQAPSSAHGAPYPATCPSHHALPPAPRLPLPPVPIGLSGWMPPEAAIAAAEQVEACPSWPCPTCTLVNAPSAYSCEACGGRRPGAGPEAFPSLASAFPSLGSSGSAQQQRPASGSGASAGPSGSNGVGVGAGKKKVGKQLAVLQQPRLASRPGRPLPHPPSPSPPPPPPPPLLSNCQSFIARCPNHVFRGPAQTRKCYNSEGPCVRGTVPLYRGFENRKPTMKTVISWISVANWRF